jgi:hypothetical protein
MFQRKLRTQLRSSLDSSVLVEHGQDTVKSVEHSVSHALDDKRAVTPRKARHSSPRCSTPSLESTSTPSSSPSASTRPSHSQASMLPESKIRKFANLIVSSLGHPSTDLPRSHSSAQLQVPLAPHTPSSSSTSIVATPSTTQSQEAISACGPVVVVIEEFAGEATKSESETDQINSTARVTHLPDLRLEINNQGPRYHSVLFLSFLDC